MLNALSLPLLGFLLGVRHALDPDHVVAMSTIASRSPTLRRAVLVGAIWGMGHTLTIVAVGGAIIGLKVTISPRLGLAMEFAVALMLVALGAYNLFLARRGELTEPSTARPFLVGMVHGLAGSAAVALLVLAAVDSALWAMGYLLLFGAGTVGGMAVATTAIALPAAMAAARVAAARRWLTAASGALSLLFGLALAYTLGGPGGLFSDAPRWTPH
jgi:high-affinity nickel-transport protein